MRGSGTKKLHICEVFFKENCFNFLENDKIIQIMCSHTRVRCKLLFIEGLLKTLTYIAKKQGGKRFRLDFTSHGN